MQQHHTNDVSNKRKCDEAQSFKSDNLIVGGTLMPLNRNLHPSLFCVHTYLET